MYRVLAKTEAAIPMSEGHLQRELKKRRPFESDEEEALLNLWRTHDKFQIRFVRFFREFGLTPSQYNVLRILRGEGKPLPSLEIADRLITAVPAITGLIDRLEGMELIARDRSTDDRRVVFVSISPKGLDKVNAMDAPLAALHKKLIGHLSRAELAELSRLLEKARGSNVGATG
jgi:MarR family transcriptional regulator, 2-MHQ and catechol-resistance regulon repressor